LRPAEAQLLIAEQWAIRERRSDARGEGPRQYMSQASDRRQPDTHPRVPAERLSRQPLARAADSAPQPSGSRRRKSPRRNT
jgi:hypothetical protein